MVPLQQLRDVLRLQMDGVSASCIEFRWIGMLERAQYYRANGRDDVDPESKGGTGLTGQFVVLLGEARFFSGCSISVQDTFCDSFVECRYCAAKSTVIIRLRTTLNQLRYSLHSATGKRPS